MVLWWKSVVGLGWRGSGASNISVLLITVLQRVNILYILVSLVSSLCSNGPRRSTQSPGCCFVSNVSEGQLGWSSQYQWPHRHVQSTYDSIPYFSHFLTFLRQTCNKSETNVGH